VFARTDPDGTTLVADPNQILFFNEGQPYRYAHPLPGGDDCTILTLDPECARSAAERFGRPRTGESQGPRFPSGSALSTPRAARLHHELLDLASEAGAAPELAVQDVVAELIDEANQASRVSPVIAGTRTTLEPHQISCRLPPGCHRAARTGRASP
jgi:hypothetical protein